MPGKKGASWTTAVQQQTNVSSHQVDGRSGSDALLQTCLTAMMLCTVCHVQCQWQSSAATIAAVMLLYPQMHLHYSSVIANSLSSHVHSCGLPYLRFGLHSSLC